MYIHKIERKGKDSAVPAEGNYFSKTQMPMNN